MTEHGTNEPGGLEVEPSTAGATAHRDHESPMHSLGLLAIFLRGSETSFTGLLLQLIAKADWGNRVRLRMAFPREVMVWETWMAMDPTPTATELAAALEGNER